MEFGQAQNAKKGPVQEPPIQQCAPHVIKKLRSTTRKAAFSASELKTSRICYAPVCSVMRTNGRVGSTLSLLECRMTMWNPNLTLRLRICRMTSWQRSARPQQGQAATTYFNIRPP